VVHLSIEQERAVRQEISNIEYENKTLYERKVAEVNDRRTSWRVFSGFCTGSMICSVPLGIVGILCIIYSKLYILNVMFAVMALYVAVFTTLDFKNNSREKLSTYELMYSLLACLSLENQSDATIVERYANYDYIRSCLEKYPIDALYKEVDDLNKCAEQPVAEEASEADG
jgi:hypothetical protein